MKMKRFIISAILVFALTSYAYGWGSHGGHHHNYSGSNSGGSINTDNSGGNEATLQVQALNTNGNFVPVPEPTTLLLLGAGLIGIAAGLARKKFKK
jgi:hypothetical protein